VSISAAPMAKKMRGNRAGEDGDEFPGDMVVRFVDKVLLARHDGSASAPSIVVYTQSEVQQEC